MSENSTTMVCKYFTMETIKFVFRPFNKFISFLVQILHNICFNLLFKNLLQFALTTYNNFIEKK